MKIEELQKLMTHMELTPLGVELGISLHELKNLRDGKFKHIRFYTVEKLITYFNLGK